jgi:hypothetical protein
MASLLGLATTSSPLLGVAIGLYVPFSKRPLACLLAFAAGSLISALAIELGYEAHSPFIIKASTLMRHGRLSAPDLPPAPLSITRHRCSWRKKERPSATSPSFANMPWPANRPMRASASSYWQRAT